MATSQPLTCQVKLFLSADPVGCGKWTIFEDSPPIFFIAQTQQVQYLLLPDTPSYTTNPYLALMSSASDFDLDSSFGSGQATTKPSAWATLSSAVGNCVLGFLPTLCQTYALSKLGSDASSLAKMATSIGVLSSANACLRAMHPVPWDPTELEIYNNLLPAACSHLAVSTLGAQSPLKTFLASMGGQCLSIIPNLIGKAALTAYNPEYVQSLLKEMQKGESPLMTGYSVKSGMFDKI